MKTIPLLLVAVLLGACNYRFTDPPAAASVGTDNLGIYVQRGAKGNIHIHVGELCTAARCHTAVTWVEHRGDRIRTRCFRLVKPAGSDVALLYPLAGSRPAETAHLIRLELADGVLRYRLANNRAIIERVREGWIAGEVTGDRRNRVVVIDGEFSAFCAGIADEACWQREQRAERAVVLGPRELMVRR